MEILIKRLNKNAKLPIYGREAGPGIDIYTLNEVVIEPMARVRVSTGVAMAMPVGYIGVIWSHDTMVIDNPIKVTTGIIDSGYRDEIIVELTNTGLESIVINAGEIMAQLLVQHVHHAHLIEAEDLSSSNS